MKIKTPNTKPQTPNTTHQHGNIGSDSRRLWHISRIMSRRLTDTTLGDLRKLLSKIPSDCDPMSLKTVLSLSAACDLIEDITRRMAGWPSVTEELRRAGTDNNKKGTRPMKFFVKSVYANGRTYFFNRELIATRRWSLSWHPHTRECRYGWYHNKTLLGGGLWMALNLPLLGDWALWKNWEGKTYQK